MSEQWKKLLETAREIAKAAKESDEQTAESVNSLCTNFQEVQNLIHKYLLALSKLSKQEEDYDREESETSDFVKAVIVDSRRALRFTMCLLSIEPTRGKVQDKACSTFELHKSISSLISHRKCDAKCRLMAAQILCNLGTSNASTARRILDDIKPSPTESEVKNILLEKLSVHESEIDHANMKENPSWAQMVQSSGGSGSRNILGAVVAALHNAIASVENGHDDLDYAINITKELSSDKMLMCNMIRYILPSEVVQQGKEGEKVKEASDFSDEATEWISRLVEKLCTLGMLPNIYRSLGSNAQVQNDKDDLELKTSIGIAPEQLVLLHCAGSAIAEYTRTLHTVNHCDVHPLGGACDFQVMTSTFRFLATEYGNLRRKLKATDDHDTERYGGENACIENAATMIIDILSNSMSVDEKVDGKSFVQIRLHVGQTTDMIPSLLLDLGVLVDKLGIENRGINARELKIEESDQHLVTTIVQLIGNICYRCPENQDLVRKTNVPIPNASNGNVEEYTQLPSKESGASNNGVRNGLHVLLSCTSFAYGCFTLREWAIVAIRNVLEGNEENQKQVEELEAQQALETPELQKLGMKVNLDKRGQVSVTPNDR